MGIVPAPQLGKAASAPLSRLRALPQWQMLLIAAVIVASLLTSAATQASTAFDSDLNSSIPFLIGIVDSADTMQKDESGPRRTLVEGAETVEGHQQPGAVYSPEPGFFHSPTGALLRSVAIPGWGQWFNGKKHKATIIAAVEGYFITKALTWRHRARESGLDFDTFDHRRDRRNFFYWLTGATIFVSMFDAYGDRYLLALERTRDAEDEYWGGRKEGQAMRWPTSPPGEWRVSLRLRF